MLLSCAEAAILTVCGNVAKWLPMMCSRNWLLVSTWTQICTRRWLHASNVLPVQLAGRRILNAGLKPVEVDCVGAGRGAKDVGIRRWREAGHWLVGDGRGGAPTGEMWGSAGLDYGSAFTFAGRLHLLERFLSERTFFAVWSKMEEDPATPGPGTVSEIMVHSHWGCAARRPL